MEPQLSQSQREALRAFCDTIVPSIERQPDPEGFWARKASDLAVDQAAGDLILQIPDETVRGGLLQLLDVLASQGIAEEGKSQLSREQIIRNLQLASPDAAAGVGAIAGMTCFLHYGAPDPQSGQNPNWQVFNYPGPSSPPPQVEKPLHPLELSAVPLDPADRQAAHLGAVKLFEDVVRHLRADDSDDELQVARSLFVDGRESVRPAAKRHSPGVQNLPGAFVRVEVRR